MKQLQKHKLIFEEVKRRERILLLTDRRIDGDAVGSALAMYHWLRSLGKDVYVYSHDEVPGQFSFLPDVEVVSTDEELFKMHFDLVMVFDCSEASYIASILDQIDGTQPTIQFDHHDTNPLYATINHVNIEASSTGEMVWQFFKDNEVRITKDMAICLLAAICYDTHVFINDATNHICMEAAAELGMAGAKLQTIVRAYYMNKSLEALHLWGLALERLDQVAGDVMVTYIRQDDLKRLNATDEDADGIANFLIGAAGEAEIVCVLREVPGGSVKASLRTLTKDVAAIAQMYGGGGHVKASGFTIQDSQLAQTSAGWEVQSKDKIYPVSTLFELPSTKS